MLATLRRGWTRFCALPGIIRYAIVLAILLIAVPAFAGDLVLKNKDTGSELRLMDSQCSHGETLAILKEEWRPHFKNARILNAKGHIEWFGCWVQHDADTALVILQDGGTMEFNLAAFSDPMI